MREVHRKLDEILCLVRGIAQGVSIMSVELDALEAQVATNTSVEESAVTLIKGIAAQLAAAGTDPVKLKSLAASLNTSATDLAAAVAANTPATPPTA